MTLTDFLLARIAEDEATARFEDCEPGADLPEDDAYSALGGADPQRVLAECEAKRRIVELCGPIAGYGSTLPAVAMECLLDLAAVYADHPDYRDEWRP